MTQTDENKLIIEKLPQGQLYKIRFTQGGNLPIELKGLYNKLKWAEKAIADYEAKKAKPKREYRKAGTAEQRRKAKKVKEDGKSITES